MKTDIVKQYVSLRGALEREKAQLQSRLDEINQLLYPNGSGGGRRLSPEARSRISEAAKARWARYRKTTGTAKGTGTGRKLNAAAKARLAAIAKARWAKAKAAGRSAL